MTSIRSSSAEDAASGCAAKHLYDSAKEISFLPEKEEGCLALEANRCKAFRRCILGKY